MSLCPVVISMLRGVNVGGHHRLKMDALKTLYESAGLREARTYLQSGNVLFQTEERDHTRLASQIEDAIAKAFGFRPRVILRTPAELDTVIGRSPFAGRDLNPSKLLVMFFGGLPGSEACDELAAMKTDPEELHIDGREVYIYYPNGAGRSKLSAALIEKTLRTYGTARNWNTVTGLRELAQTFAADR